MACMHSIDGLASLNIAKVYLYAIPGFRHSEPYPFKNRVRPICTQTHY